MFPRNLLYRKTPRKSKQSWKRNTKGYVVKKFTRQIVTFKNTSETSSER